MFHTSISGSGCDCDESAPNPDDLCALDEKCKQCKCIPEGEGKTLYKLLSRRCMHSCPLQAATVTRLLPTLMSCVPETTSATSASVYHQVSPIFNLHCFHYISIYNIYMSTAIASNSL